MVYGIGTIGPTNANPHENSFVVRTHITVDQFASFRDSIDTVQGVTAARQFRLVEKNYQRIISAEKFYKNAIARRVDTSDLNATAVVDNLSVDIINWLMATRMFLDHHQTTLSDQYGSGSVQVGRFKAACSAEFDGSVAYRFMYKLRNFTQHCGFPLNRLTVSARNPDADDWSPVVRLSAERDGLLRDFDWGAKVRSDIQSMPDEVDVLAMLRAAAPCFRRIFAEIINIRLNNCVDAITKVREAAALYESVTAEKFLMECTVRPEGQGQSISYKRLPVEICDWLEDEDGPQRYLQRISQVEAPENRMDFSEITSETKDLLQVGLQSYADYYALGGVNPDFISSIREQIATEGDVFPVVAGSIMVGAIGISMAAAALGTSPQDVLGGIVLPLAE